MNGIWLESGSVPDCVLCSGCFVDQVRTLGLGKRSVIC
jgi:hypothetical protein